jgi:hypothetical protein
MNGNFSTLSRAIPVRPFDELRVCELIGFCKNEQPQLFDFVEAKIAESDVFSIFSQPLRPPNFDFFS